MFGVSEVAADKNTKMALILKMEKLKLEYIKSWNVKFHHKIIFCKNKEWSKMVKIKGTDQMWPWKQWKLSIWMALGPYFYENLSSCTSLNKYRPPASHYEYYRIQNLNN